MGRRVGAIAIGGWALVSAIACRGVAQSITRDNYYDYLPPPSVLVAQTRASAALHLFGDRSASSFTDTAPADGIDDRRGARLLRIAERFSPILRRNNFNVPRDPRGILGAPVPLIADLWEQGRRIRSDTIHLRATSAGVGVQLASADSSAREVNDRALTELLRTRGPNAVAQQVDAAEGGSERVLYFDFPGSDRPSWRAAYRDQRPDSASHIFAHAFIHESIEARGEARYQLVMQFWFFYPFNDAVNAHEGDWEHINVITTTRERAAAARTAAAALLTPAEIARVLNDDFPLDSLVIAAVNYYFHQQVTTLDYVDLGYHPAGTSDASADARYVWEDLHFVRDAVRKRLTFGGGRLATHPLVYVGGDNKGPDELLTLRPRFHASFKRNSGSSYPFPGTWQTVAGFGVTEKVRGTIVPFLRSDTTLSLRDAIADDAYVAYSAENITLLPDWEMLLDGLNGVAAVRDEWAWLVLPIYWGFPVSRSTGGGLLKHTDFGNISPMGPAFETAWNRVGTFPDYSDYQIRVLRTPLSPTTPWAVLRSGWGVLNIPFAAWGLMPGYNVAVIELTPWMAGAMNVLGAPQARTFSPDRLPRRFTTEGQGVFREFGGREFAGLLAGPQSTRVTAAQRPAHYGPRLWFNLNFGEHFSLENTYSWSTSGIRYAALAANGSTTSVTGSLEMRQLTGGIRYDLIPLGSENIQFYGRGGYGWLWYRALDERLNGVPSAAPAVTRGYLPPILPSRHWLPNLFYGGGGVEAFSPRRYWLFGLLGYGIRAEYSEYFHRLRFDGGTARGDVTTRRHDLAASLIFGW